MHIPNIIKPSRIKGRPTVVLIAPQECGSRRFGAHIAEYLNCSHTIDGEAEVPPEGVPLDAALIIFDNGAEIGGGDITITCHTTAGFEALIMALELAGRDSLEAA